MTAPKVFAVLLCALWILFLAAHGIAGALERGQAAIEVQP